MGMEERKKKKEETEIESGGVEKGSLESFGRKWMRGEGDRRRCDAAGGGGWGTIEAPAQSIGRELLLAVPS